MSLQRWVEQHPGMDAIELARRILQEDPETAIAALGDRIEWLRRQNVRGIEEAQHRAFFDRMLRPQRRLGVTSPPDIPPRERDEATLRQLNRFLELSFALGDGERVTWGEATIEQHERRIAMLKKQVKGTVRTIRRHEEAVRRLREAGAMCLAELAARPEQGEGAA